MKSAGLCFSLAVAALFAQQDMGVITGVITDASGLSVPGARVTTTNRDTGETRSVDTSDTGPTPSARSALAVTICRSRSPASRNPFSKTSNSTPRTAFART
jgi:hypothetical protein